MMGALQVLDAKTPPLLHAALRSAARLIDAPAARTGLMPAAVRIERSRARGGAGVSEQTALTLWFGEGPSLPSPGAGRGRMVAGTALALAGAAALGAATYLVNQREPARITKPVGEPPRPLIAATTASPQS